MARLLARARLWLVSALRPLLPASARRTLRRTDELLDPVRVALYRRSSGETRPVPPRLLRERVGSTSIRSYFETGARWAAGVSRGCERGGRSLADCDAVLDFGCGSGRVLQHLRDAQGPELHGCDIHAPSVRWMARAFPELHTWVSPFRPPLEVEDSRFDCIYAWSVFSHLPEPDMRDWLIELRRVLAPGGLLLVSTLGEDSELPGRLRAPRVDRSAVQSRGIVFVPYVRGDGLCGEEFTGTAQDYGITYISHEYARRTFGEVLDVVDILPLELDSIQDLTVLRRRA